MNRLSYLRGGASFVSRPSIVLVFRKHNSGSGPLGGLPRLGLWRGIKASPSPLVFTVEQRSTLVITNFLLTERIRSAGTLSLQPVGSSLDILVDRIYLVHQKASRRKRTI